MAKNDIPLDKDVADYIDKILHNNPQLTLDESLASKFNALISENEYKEALNDYIKNDVSEVAFWLRFLDLYHEYQEEQDRELEAFLPELSELLSKDDDESTNDETDPESEETEDEDHPKHVYTEQNGKIILNANIYGKDIQLECDTKDNAMFAYVYLKTKASENNDEQAKNSLKLLAKSEQYKNIIDNLDENVHKYPETAAKIDKIIKELQAPITKRQRLS